MQKSFNFRFQLSELYVDLKKVDSAVVVLKKCLELSKDPADRPDTQNQNRAGKGLPAQGGAGRGPGQMWRRSLRKIPAVWRLIL